MMPQHHIVSFQTVKSNQIQFLNLEYLPSPSGPNSVQWLKYCKWSSQHLIICVYCKKVQFGFEQWCWGKGGKSLLPVAFLCPEIALQNCYLPCRKNMSVIIWVTVCLSKQGKQQFHWTILERRNSTRERLISPHHLRCLLFKKIIHWELSWWVCQNHQDWILNCNSIREVFASLT